jgi:hypothetical protein
LKFLSLEVGTKHTVPLLATTNAVVVVEAIVGPELRPALIKTPWSMFQVVFKGVMCLLKLWKGRMNNLTEERCA